MAEFFAFSRGTRNIPFAISLGFGGSSAARCTGALAHWRASILRRKKLMSCAEIVTMMEEENRKNEDIGVL